MNDEYSGSETDAAESVVKQMLDYEYSSSETDAAESAVKQMLDYEIPAVKQMLQSQQ